MIAATSCARRRFLDDEAVDVVVTAESRQKALQDSVSAAVPLVVGVVIVVVLLAAVAVVVGVGIRRSPFTAAAFSHFRPSSSFVPRIAATSNVRVRLQPVSYRYGSAETCGLLTFAMMHNDAGYESGLQWLQSTSKPRGAAETDERRAKERARKVPAHSLQSVTQSVPLQSSW